MIRPPNLEDSRPLHVAAYKDNPQAAAILLKHGASIDLTDGTGCTPLHWAAMQGSPKVARILLAAGASTEIRDNTHYNACRIERQLTDD
jgi:ankyrin repeat protein